MVLAHLGGSRSGCAESNGRRISVVRGREKAGQLARGDDNLERSLLTGVNQGPSNKKGMFSREDQVEVRTDMDRNKRQSY